MKRLFLATISVVLLLTGCYKDDIRQMHSEIDSLRDAKIASLSEQAEGIKASIDELNGMGESLQQYISALESSEKSVTEDLDGLAEKIAAFEQAAGTDIDAFAADFLEKVKGLESAALAELATISSAAAALDEDGDALGAGIEGLKAYLDGKFAEKSSLEGTYGTLEIQEIIIEDIERIKYLIEALSADSDELNQMLKDMISENTGEFSKEFSGKVQADANSILDACAAALSDIESAFSQSGSEAVLKAAGECETSVMAWINEKLDDYCKLADAEAQIEACKLVLGAVPEGKSLQGEIDDAVSELGKAKAAVNDIYTKAIEDAIKEHSGLISAKIDAQIQNLRDTVIAPATARVEPLKTQVNDLWTAVGELEDKILSAERQGEAISASLAVLTDLHKTLQEYVESVKTELSNTDKANYDYLKGLIDELDSIINGKDEKSFSSQLAALKAYVGTLPQGATDVATWISSTFTTLDNQFNAASTIEYANEIINALKGTLETQNTKISELETKLKNLISLSENTIKGWVDTKVKATGYYTAGDITGKLSAFETELKSYFSGGDEKLQKEINAISDELDKQKTALEEAYGNAITAAINKEKGNLPAAIAAQFKPSNGKLDTLKTRSGKLKTEVDGLRSELDGYLSSVGTIESTITTLKTFLSANGYTTLLAFVNKIEGDLSTAATTYATVADLTELTAYVNGDLKTEVDKIAGLVNRLDSVESDLTSIGNFLSGSATATNTLKQQYDAIIGYIAALKTTVNGTDSSLGLQAQIDAIKTALYGDPMDDDNPSADSIMGMLKEAAAILSAEQLYSISYVPSYLDHKEALSANSAGTYFAQFKFMLKPASIAQLATRNPEFFVMKFKSYDGNTLYNFDNQAISADSDGVLTIVVSESTHTNILASGACAALFYDNVDKNGNVLSSFTSEFIPMIVATTSGTGKIPASNTNLVFPAEGGSIEITVGDAETGKFWLVHDQDIDYYDTLVPAWYKLTELFFRSLFPASWIHVSPNEPNGPDLSMPWRKYYQGETKITISVDPNTSTKPRDGKLVFRIITLDISLEQDLIINIHQEGRTN